MDVLSLIGIIMAFVAIIGGNYLEGGHLSALANGPAALIVLGGTIGAALLQSPMSAFKRAVQILGWILFPPRVDLPGGIDRVVNWSLTARKEGLLGLEGVADAQHLGLVAHLGVDGVDEAEFGRLLARIVAALEQGEVEQVIAGDAQALRDGRPQVFFRMVDRQLEFSDS